MKNLKWIVMALLLFGILYECTYGDAKSHLLIEVGSHKFEFNH